MAEQRMKVRDKKVQKMTKDGLVEENLTDKSSVRVSNRVGDVQMLSLIHISEPTRQAEISYAVFCLKKKKKKKKK